MKIENIIQEVGLNYAWLNNDVRNIHTFCKMVTTRLQCQFVQNWNGDFLNSSKCLNYRLFKTTFSLENYITEMPLKSAILLARFRTTNHKLPIEKGRWENIERNQRLYNLYNKNALGDEYNFLLECDFFNTQRQLYIPKYYWKHCDTLLMSSLVK